MKNMTVVWIVIIGIIIAVAAFLTYNYFYCGSYICFMDEYSNEIKTPIEQDVFSGEVVAVYNGKEIASEELDKSYDLFFFFRGLPENYKALLTKTSFLNQMLAERLSYDKAVEAGYDVSTKEAENNLNEMLELSGVTQEMFNEQMSGQSFDYNFLINEYRRQLIITKYINESLFSEIIVSDSEIENFYNENKNMMEVPEQIKASHILLETEDEAKDIISKLDAGDDFATLAGEFSTGPTSVSGGDLGYFGRGMMVKEFEDAAFNLEIGEYTKEPVQTQFGYHVILVEDKQAAKTLSLEEARENIRNQLLTEKQTEFLETVGDSNKFELNLKQKEIEEKNMDFDLIAVNLPRRQNDSATDPGLSGGQTMVEAG